jgi:hypothetical protein
MPYSSEGIKVFFYNILGKKKDFLHYFNYHVQPILQQFTLFLAHILYTTYKSMTGL